MYTNNKATYKSRNANWFYVNIKNEPYLTERETFIPNSFNLAFMVNFNDVVEETKRRKRASY